MNDEWNCPTCTFINRNNIYKTCEICGYNEILANERNRDAKLAYQLQIKEINNTKMTDFEDEKVKLLNLRFCICDIFLVMYFCIVF